MTREEFLELNIGDRVYVTIGGADKGKLCEVTEIFPLIPEMRKLMQHGLVTAKVLDGEFNTGEINPDGSKTLKYKSWKKRSNFITNILEGKGD